MSSGAAAELARLIAASGLTIYDALDTRPELLFPLDLLEVRLSEHFTGTWLGGPPRTRSKVAKQMTCAALGYPTPASFRKVSPRFLGQQLEVLVQQADNVQIWNSEVSPAFRYALIRPDSNDIVQAVRVISGDELATFDTTGTLTSKFQAKRLAGRSGSSLVSAVDTDHAAELVGSPVDHAGTRNGSTALPPTRGQMLPITEIYSRLLPLIGTELHDPGRSQDRLRGEELQRAAADQLRTERYANFGQFPDLPSQALEVKLQTSPTIDLGLVLPSSPEIAEGLGGTLSHSDVRYAIFYGSTTPRNTVVLEELVVTTGRDFFTEFQQFGGLSVNRKIQLPLPRNFFQSKR